jgi:hypothetical protein
LPRLRDWWWLVVGGRASRSCARTCSWLRGVALMRCHSVHLLRGWRASAVGESQSRLRVCSRAGVGKARLVRCTSSEPAARHPFPPVTAPQKPPPPLPPPSPSLAPVAGHRVPLCAPSLPPAAPRRRYFRPRGGVAMAQRQVPARGMVACVTSPSACTAPVRSPAGLMPSLAPGVLCGMCVAGARSGGVDGDGVDAVEADAPGRLRARALAVCASSHTNAVRRGGGVAGACARCGVWQQCDCVRVVVVVAFQFAGWGDAAPPPPPGGGW